MYFLLALVVWGILVLLFTFVGRTITKIFKIEEENSLLKHLIEITVGISSLLIIINLIGRITGNFYLALFIALLVTVFICILRRSEFVEFLKNLYEKLAGLKNLSFIKDTSNKYFIIFGEPAHRP